MNLGGLADDDLLAFNESPPPFFEILLMDFYKPGINCTE